MFDHVVFGVTDYAASKAFFLKALEPLGVAVVQEGPLGVELSADRKSSLCMYQAEEKPARLHLAFTAENRHQVEAFYRAALEAGGKDHGAPGLRPQYHANYYAAFVIAPDGHNVEVVCHEPKERTLYMVIERFKNRDARAIYARFAEKGRMMPDGLAYVGSWIDHDFDRCFQVMECDDERLLREWADAWKDLMDFEFVPVRTSAKARAAALGEP